MKRDAAVTAVLAASLLLVCRMTLSVAAIPPWQQSDEPLQLAWSEAALSRLTGNAAVDPAREAEILQSMSDYDWWKHYGVATPSPLPVKFLDAGGLTITIDPQENSQDVYYKLVAAVLWFAPHMSVVGDLYVMRAISAIFALLTLWMAWHGSREFLGAASGATVATLLALHPQFAIVATTAGPDACVDLLAVCICWQAMRALRRTDRRRSLAIMWLAAISAAVVDRMGAPLLLIALIVSAVELVRRKGLHRSTMVLLLAGVAVFGVTMLVLETQWQSLSKVGWAEVFSLGDQNWSFFLRFSTFLLQSWWSSLGWARYAPPPWWSMTVFLLTAVAAVGLVRRVARARDADLHWLVTVAMVMLSVQMLAEYWLYFRLGSMGQGRHLFPALVPTLVLFWLGVEGWVPGRYRQFAAVGSIVVFAFLDFFVWTLVAVPAYASTW